MSDSDSVAPDFSAAGGIPSLEDLRIFLAVARAGSFRSAASQLFTSQPSLSRAVARLEQTLGASLLERGPRGVVLTRGGEVLTEGARRILDATAALRQEVLRPDSQSLHIGATATSARTFLAPFLAEWIPQHPDIRLSAIEGTDDQLQERLRNNECDAAVISAKPASGFERLKLNTVQVMAMIPLGHRLSTTTDPVSVLDLVPETLLLNGRGFPSTNLLLYAMEVAGHSPTIVFECSAGQTLAAAAEAGMGIAVFGDTTNVHGLNVVARPVFDAGGAPLRFDLHISWNSLAPAIVRDFCIALATSHQVVRDTDQDQDGVAAAVQSFRE